MNSFLKDIYLYRAFPKNSFNIIQPSYANYLNNSSISSITYKDFLQQYKKNEYRLLQNQFLFASEVLDKKLYKSEVNSIKIVFELENMEVNKKLSSTNSSFSISSRKDTILSLNRDIY